MYVIQVLIASLFLVIYQTSAAQTGSITGIITINGQATELAQLAIASTELGTTTDSKGQYIISHIPFGSYRITASYIGFESVTNEFTLDEYHTHIALDFDLSEQTLQLDELVITGTKTFKRQTNSAVIVNVINSQTMSNVQACNLSESLRYQPGLRVETNCQTCNYTQLRMNGLAGGYSQILINGRPIFSPLTGLYGMEQLPTNMIDRIEVVRGGGSSLYGSSAIGGTANVITKIPKKNSYEWDYNYQHIDGQTDDNTFSGNATLLSKSKLSGISLFMNHRHRGFYDANDDNFSEIPLVKTTSFGANLFFIPKANQKLELNISKIYEYRWGGEMLHSVPAYLALQAEERTHNVWMGSADYQINFNNENSSIITYFAWQNTDRTHYTGIQPDEGTPDYETFIAYPPYGTSDVSTYNLGVQLNHSVDDFLRGINVFTIGAEYLYDDVWDEIPTYDYLIDQETKDFGIFLQSDWQIVPRLTLLSGVRMDIHNLVDRPIYSPRASLLYKFNTNAQLRFSYGTGFRAPQAFDSDLHIAFAAGGVSRVTLSSDLKQENSQSWSTSINYDKPMENWITGFTIEGFYNRLKDVFYLNPIGQDRFGQQFEKQNGDGATVKGITMELRANYNRQLQLESGYTLQTSRFDTPVAYIDELAGIREFVRTPNQYGYAIMTFTPTDRWSAVLNYVHTGSMKIPHFAGAPNQTTNEIFTSDVFSEWGFKVGYTIPVPSMYNGIEFYGGVKNIFNAYQGDFDIGKNRDSNFIYGPAQPRILFFGVKIKSE